MSTRRRFALIAIVWLLRLTALASFAIWFIPEDRYSVTDIGEETYYGMGWPDHWLASRVTVQYWWMPDFARPKQSEQRRLGPRYAWDPVPIRQDLDRAFSYGRWQRANPLFGPVWQIGVAAILWIVARYLSQFRKPSRPAEALT